MPKVHLRSAELLNLRAAGPRPHDVFAAGVGVADRGVGLVAAL
jgi:hypothetical protein